MKTVKYVTNVAPKDLYDALVQHVAHVYAVVAQGNPEQQKIKC